MDRAYQDIDVRILRTGETTVLVYGFTDDNTVVITSDLNTFIELLGE
jgi:DeoR/GlpR family transcriptional regulator of sugar metabolism